MSRRDQGAYQVDHTREVLDHVKRLAERGDSYRDIAAQVKRTHRLNRFTKVNVASMIHRMRKRGELPQTKRTGGKAKAPSMFDRRPKMSITLAKV